MKLVSKRFTTLSQIKLVEESICKNLLLLGKEQDIINDDTLKKSIFNIVSRVIKFKISKHEFNYLDPSLPLHSCIDRIHIAALSENNEQDREKVTSLFRSLSKTDSLSIKFYDSLNINTINSIINVLILTNYKFHKKTFTLKEKDNIQSEQFKIIKELNFVTNKTINDNKELVNFWIELANAKIYTRTLANERGNPDFLEDEARKVLSELNSKMVEIEIIKGKELKERNLELLYSVGKAAKSEPRLIMLSYKGNPQEENFKYSVIGKGVTFDTGGLNLKPTKYIEEMFYDKHGACNSLAIFKSAVRLNLPINLVCAMAIAENSIDSDSYKPSDILTSFKGYTIEITNTDAEGRLCLADALSYVQKKYKPSVVIDFATLTGAIVMGLVFIFFNFRDIKQQDCLLMIVS